MESDVFTIEPGTTDYQAYSDVPSGVQYIGVSPCTHNSPCNGVQSDVICGNPQWQMIGFSYPGSSGCCLSRIGSDECGYSTSFSQGSFTATWTTVSSSDILVVFDL